MAVKSVQGRTLEPYKAYNFRDKDPVIDELRTIIQQEHKGTLNTKVLKRIEVNGGPRAQTMVGWFFKKTKRPQSAGIESCGRAMGYYRPWMKMPPALAAIAAKGAINKKKKRNGHG